MDLVIKSLRVAGYAVPAGASQDVLASLGTPVTVWDRAPVRPQVVSGSWLDGSVNQGASTSSGSLGRVPLPLRRSFLIR